MRDINTYQSRMFPSSEPERMYLSSILALVLCNNSKSRASAGCFRNIHDFFVFLAANDIASRFPAFDEEVAV